MTTLRARLGHLAREPLVHFAAGALALFLLYALLAEPVEPVADERTITVDDQALTTFLQYRSNAFRAEYFSQQLAEMTPDARESLVRDFIEAEALYREARTLGLAEGDYVIRQRLIQKMRYLLQNLVAPAEPTEAELAAYFAAHAETYSDAATVTFTHVFFDAADGEASARARATALLARLNESHASFDDALEHGDRFPFFRHYVERTTDYVASHFGAAFAAAVGELDPSPDHWRGPLESTHGWHLLLLTEREPVRVPRLDEVRERVAEDLRRERLAAALAEAVRGVVDRYDVDGLVEGAEPVRR